MPKSRNANARNAKLSAKEEVEQLKKDVKNANRRKKVRDAKEASKDEVKQKQQKIDDAAKKGRNRRRAAREATDKTRDAGKKSLNKRQAARAARPSPNAQANPKLISDLNQTAKSQTGGRSMVPYQEKPVATTAKPTAKPTPSNTSLRPTPSSTTTGIKGVGGRVASAAGKVARGAAAHPIATTVLAGSALVSGAQSMATDGYRAKGSGGRNRTKQEGGRTAAAMPIASTSTPTATPAKVSSDNNTTTAAPTPKPSSGSKPSGGKKYAEGYRSQGNAGMGQRGRKRPAPVQEGPTRPAVEPRNTKDSWWSQQSAQKSYDQYQKLMDYAEGGEVKKAKPNTLGWGMAASAANAAANRNRVMNDRLGKIMGQMPNRKQNKDKGKGDK